MTSPSLSLSLSPSHTTSPTTTTTAVEPYILCLGEILIDFTAAGYSTVGSPLFEQNAGGAPANVACALSRLGSRAHFCSRVGSDMFGKYLKAVLQAEGVDPRHVTEDSNAPTTLAFVALHPDGERYFSFVRNPGADTTLEASDVPWELLKGASIFHFGTLSLTHQPAADTLLSAVAYAKENGVLTSIDVNLRSSLWPDLRQAHAEIHRILPKCDVVKMSGDELAFAIEGPGYYHTPDEKDIAALASSLLLTYPEMLLLAITLGARGSQIFYRSVAGGDFASLCVSAHRVCVVDSTGAGDSFVAGLLHSILRYGSIFELLTTVDTVRRAAEFASAAAALCVTKRGAIAAMPYIEDVRKLLKGTRE